MKDTRCALHKRTVMLFLHGMMRVKHWIKFTTMSYDDQHYSIASREDCVAAVVAGVIVGQMAGASVLTEGISVLA